MNIVCITSEYSEKYNHDGDVTIIYLTYWYEYNNTQIVDYVISQIGWV